MGLRVPLPILASMTTSRITRRLLSGLTLAALLATACSSSAPPAAGDGSAAGGQIDPLAMVVAASDKIDASNALAMEFTMTISAAGTELTGSGSAVTAGDGSSMRMDMSYDSFPGMPDGFDMEIILDDGTMYMSTATFAAAGAPTEALGDKEWVSIDLNDVVPGYESFADLATGQNDPSQAFEYLKGAEDVELVGTEEIDGESTQHLRGTLNLQTALDELPAEAQEELRATMQELEAQIGTTSMPFEAWVDDQGRVRRMSYTMESGADAPQAFSLAMTLDITDYDAELDFDVPSPDEAVDLGELAASGA